VEKKKSRVKKDKEKTVISHNKYTPYTHSHQLLPRPPVPAVVDNSHHLIDLLNAKRFPHVRNRYAADAQLIDLAGRTHHGPDAIARAWREAVPWASLRRDIESVTTDMGGRRRPGLGASANGASAGNDADAGGAGADPGQRSSAAELAADARFRGIAGNWDGRESAPLDVPGVAERACHAFERGRYVAINATSGAQEEGTYFVVWRREDPLSSRWFIAFDLLHVGA
jgi:hypothetical protein